MTVLLRLPLLAALLSTVFAGSAFAQNSGIEQLGQNVDWQGFRYTENGSQVCFMAQKLPEDRMSGNYTRRGDVFAQVTHRPAENQIGVFSYIAGYEYRSDSVVSATIDDDRRFDFFTAEQGHAFSQDTSMDARLVEAMRAGLEMVVVGFSSRGTETTDTVSLRGFTATYRLISEACGVG